MKHQQTLKSWGFAWQQHPYLDALWLPEEQVADFDDGYFLALKTIELTIRAIKPDLILSDRLLAMMSPLCEHLGIPMIAMGTPGGLWKRSGRSILPGRSKLNDGKLPHLLRDRLKWQFSATISAWCYSMVANIHFMPRSFYADMGGTSLAINLFTEGFPRKENAVALSLGNNLAGPQELANALDGYMSDRTISNTPVHVFGKAKVYQQFYYSLKPEWQAHVQFMEYVDFDTVLKPYKLLIFAGGIGTLWYCLENGIYPWAVSGEIHDQNFNCERMGKLKWGQVGRELEGVPVCFDNAFDVKRDFNAQFDSNLSSIHEEIMSRLT